MMLALYLGLIFASQQSYLNLIDTGQTHRSFELLRTRSLIARFSGHVVCQNHVLKIYRDKRPYRLCTHRWRCSRHSLNLMELYDGQQTFSIPLPTSFINEDSISNRDPVTKN